MKKTSKNKVTN